MINEPRADNSISADASGSYASNRLSDAAGGIAFSGVKCLIESARRLDCAGLRGMSGMRSGTLLQTNPIQEAYRCSILKFCRLQPAA